MTAARWSEEDLALLESLRRALPEAPAAAPDVEKRGPRGGKLKAPAKPKKPHKQIEHLVAVLRSLGLEPVREHRFHPVRMWRFDVAVPSIKLGLEYHGHTGFGGGKGGASGHSTIPGLSNDCEKVNQARLLGWTVFAFTAWHFREADRQSHKMASPTELLTAWLSSKEVLCG